MTTPAASRKRAARRAAKTEAPAEAPPATTPPELTPLEKDAVNIASAVTLIRASFHVSNEIALKIVDLTLTARMQALAMKAERGMPFPFTTDAPGVEGDDGATTDAPLTEVESETND